MTEEEEFEFRLRLEREQESAAPQAVEEEEFPPEEGGRSLTESLPRQLGLTARAGIEGITSPATALGDVLGLKSSAALRSLLNRLGMPEPESDAEKFSNLVAGGMASAGGVSGIARGISKAAPTSVTGQVAEKIAEAPGMSVAAGGAATAAGEGASAAGADPVTSFLTALGVGAAVPSAAGAVRAAGASVKDVTNALRAAFGSEKAITNITEDAVAALTEGQRQQVLDALKAAKPTMPGVKPTVGEAVAARNLDVPEEQVGGAVIAMQKRLKGAKGVEDVIPTAEAAQDQAVASYIRKLVEKTNPMRETALAAARARGTQSISILADLARVMRTPEGKSEIATRTLQKIGNRIGKLTDEKTGFVDPYDLYVVRKEIGNTISGFVKPGAKWDKKQTARLEREIQKAIDESIEAAGGTGWKRYLDTYAQRMKPVQRREAVLEKKADIEKTVEPRTVAEIAEAELPTLPTLLHRPTMAVNFALRLIAKDITDPVQKELAKRMTDPEKFAELMRRPAGSPARQAASTILARAGILASLIEQHQTEQQGE